MSRSELRARLTVERLEAKRRRAAKRTSRVDQGRDFTLPAPIAAFWVEFFDVAAQWHRYRRHGA